MNVQFPPEVLACLDRIGATVPDSVEIYVVGGSVRDAVLGCPMHDLDIAIAGDALAFARRLATAFGGHCVELDDVNAVARVVFDGGPIHHVDVARLQGT